MTFIPEHKQTCTALFGGKCDCGLYDPIAPGPIIQVPVQPNLRDQFAMAALQGILACGGTHGHINGCDDEIEHSKLAFKYADAMMKVRSGSDKG